MDWFKWLSSSNLDPSLVHQYDVLFTQNQLQEDDLPFFNHEFLQSMGITIAKHRIEILKLLTPPPTKHKSSSKVLVAAKKTKNSFAKYMLKTFAHKDHSHNQRIIDNALAIVPVYDESTCKIDYDHQGSRLSKGLTKLKSSDQKKNQRPNKSAATTPESYYTSKKEYQQHSMRDNNNKVVNMNSTNGGNGSSPVFGNGKSHRRVVSFATTAPSPFDKECLQMVDAVNGSHDDHDYEHYQRHGGYVNDFDFDDGYWSAGVEETKWDSIFHNLKPT